MNSSTRHHEPPSSSAQYQRLYEIFAAVCEQSPQGRAEALDRLCGDDSDLRAEVERLLTQDAAPSALDDPAPNLMATHPKRESGDMTGLIGARPGGCLLKRLIASGGMGSVYEAEQENPRRTVAVKLLRRGMVSTSAMRRFELESQILARLRHPAIAQVYGAGAFHHDGVDIPYFVMEFVPDGQPITAYASSHNVDFHDRLQLMLKVCEAVHHGHQRGVIHRDLKPGNILVDATGEPKIIDFGVARLTDTDLAITTIHSGMHELIGTVPYMSPEQVSGDAAMIDTRVDVYALGVVMYELLTGALPFDLAGKNIPDAVQIIREQEPRPLSSLNKSLRGDIETIVSKAMDRDLQRRYQSADELALDIRRFLSNEPVMARPTSTVYHLRKFARRHRAWLSAAAMVLVALIAFAVIAGFQAIEARRQRNDALAARDQALQISELITQAFGETVLGQETVALHEVAKRVAQFLEDTSMVEPTIEAMLREQLGRFYLAMRNPKQAEPHLERALELRRTTENIDEAAVSAMQAMASLRLTQARTDEGLNLLREALEARRQLYGTDHFTLAPNHSLFVAMMAYLPDEPEAVARLAELNAMQSKLMNESHSNEGQVAVQDDFDGETLDPQWSVRLVGAEDWTYALRDSALHIDDVQPIQQTGFESISADVFLERRFRPLTDFHAEFAIGWDNGGRVDTLEALTVQLLDVKGRVLCAACFQDGWDLHYGERYAVVAPQQPYETSIRSGPASLPPAGRARIVIERTAGRVTVLWNDELLRGIAAEPLAEVRILARRIAAIASRHHYEFGSVSIDSVRICGVPAPVDAE